jgi:hypothetical protein
LVFTSKRHIGVLSRLFYFNPAANHIMPRNALNLSPVADAPARGFFGGETGTAGSLSFSP